MGERRSEGTGDGLRRPRPIERESGSDSPNPEWRRRAPAAPPTSPVGGRGRPVRQRDRSRRSRREPRGEFSFFVKGRAALEWVRPERGARALESVAVPAASGELSLALENPGERV
uniref:Uncharacterized protein n=1 Tax=Xenopus tropicalis TaxID=8364 RepID=A0A803JLC8_XENTR